MNLWTISTRNSFMQSTLDLIPPYTPVLGQLVGKRPPELDHRRQDNLDSESGHQGTLCLRCSSY